jgi:DNA-binding PucR family transcriptional regulator
MTSRINAVVDWEEWGALAELAASAERIRHPDVERVTAISADPAAVDTLEALALSESIRGAATLLNLHHSTVQQRQARLEEALGFHITSPAGRTRVLVALASLRLRDFSENVGDAE